LPPWNLRHRRLPHLPIFQECTALKVTKGSACAFNMRGMEALLYDQEQTVLAAVACSGKLILGNLKTWEEFRL
jgi:hypothetical protein